MRKGKEEEKEMVKTENHCVNCGLPCLGSDCPNQNVKVCYCDKCGEEISFDDTYYYEGMDVCEDCLKDMCKKEW